jgi:DNA-binding response OmpR family regulator
VATDDGGRAEPHLMHQRPTVMVADGDHELRQLLRLVLAGHGFRLLEAADGMEALDLARQERPDVMLLDAVMPEVDGIAVCAVLKNDPETANIQVAMLTAKAEESDRQLGLAAGADRYITKPFSPAQLVAQIRGLLTRRHASPSTNQTVPPASR